MTFYKWITSTMDNPSKPGQWGPLHISVLVGAIAAIVALALIFRKKSDKTKRIVAIVLASLILLFEVTRRSVNIYKIVNGGDNSLDHWLYILIPRPWCAISCWTIILAAFVNKKFIYNIASTTSLLCAIIFFAYPGAGFNNVYMEFENVYSIGTHTLLLISSITFICLGLTEFRYKHIWKEAIYLVGIFLYAFFEMFVLKIEDDPLYFMPGNDIQEILGTSWGVYLVIYIVFILVYFNIFYLIGDRKTVFKKRNKKVEKSLN